MCADGTRLPFQDETFDVVLCRDVLHHTVDKSEVVGELIRVCRAFGRVVIIEPNGGSPIVGLLGLLVEAERELLRNSLGGVLALLDRGQVAEPDVSWAQPFPAGRVLFHYRWGLPRLSAWLAGAVLAAEQAAELAHVGLRIEELYGQPMDIEWAMKDGRFFIVQARPITTLRSNDAATEECYDAWRAMNEHDWVATCKPG